jgi:hypothetical protein
MYHGAVIANQVFIGLIQRKRFDIMPQIAVRAPGGKHNIHARRSTAFYRPPRPVRDGQICPQQRVVKVQRYESYRLHD